MCTLQGSYALDTWWLSNRMYLQGVTARNKVFDTFRISFVVILGPSEGGWLGLRKSQKSKKSSCSHMIGNGLKRVQMTSEVVRSE